MIIRNDHPDPALFHNRVHEAGLIR
jgi:hypothetical protein